jgi:hypothetical protein
MGRCCDWAPNAKEPQIPVRRCRRVTNRAMGQTRIGFGSLEGKASLVKSGKRGIAREHGRFGKVDSRHSHCSDRLNYGGFNGHPVMEIETVDLIRGSLWIEPIVAILPPKAVEHTCCDGRDSIRAWADISCHRRHANPSVVLTRTVTGLLVLRKSVGSGFCPGDNGR